MAGSSSQVNDLGSDDLEYDGSGSQVNDHWESDLLDDYQEDTQNNHLPIASDTPQGLPIASDTPQGLPIASDIPQGLPIASDTPQGLPIASDTPQGPPIASDIPQGQYPASDLERHFDSAYAIQSSLMSNLSRLDFKNLRLAGIRTSISQQLQNMHLIPSKCDEELVIPDLIAPRPCSNTTQTVPEIKVCHGLHHDGWGLRGRQDKWMEPSCLFKHVPNSRFLVLASNENRGGHFDSFNVCIECHARDRERRRPYVNYCISKFYSPMCEAHSIQHLEQRPYNACRCKTFVEEQYWRCHICTLDTLDELNLRAQAFGKFTYPTFAFSETDNAYIDTATGERRMQAVCPILDCFEESWTSGPENLQMWMCRVCTAIIEPVHETMIWPS